MGRSPCCDESGLKKGPWTPEEDQKLAKYIHNHGHGSWRALPKLAGLNRCGKSCRLRWTNYLRPDIKRGKFSQEEEQTILNLHSVLGNKWSAIASHLPGRTDNEIKNFWNTHLKKKLIQMGFDPMTHRPRTDIFSSLQNLLAFANLKDLVDQHHSWEEQAVRLQAEAAQMATIQYLQYLLQPPASSSITNNNNFSNSTNNFNLAADMDQTINLLNTITAIPSLESSDSIPFAHLPELQIPGGFRTDNIPSVNKDMVQSSEFTVFSNGENSHSSDPWSLIPSSSTPISPLSAPLMAAENNSGNNLGDVCSSSSYGGGGGPSSSSEWPELLLEDPLFHEIA